MNKLAGMRLLQLASQSLPIGGYSHSQGLESAIEARIVHSEASVHAWIEDVLVFCMASYELAVLLEMCEAWSAGDLRALRRLNDEFLAARETAELRAATVQMGYSMRALLSVLPDIPAGLTGALSAMQNRACLWPGAARRSIGRSSPAMRPARIYGPGRKIRYWRPSRPCRWANLRGNACS